MNIATTGRFLTPEQIKEIQDLLSSNPIPVSLILEKIFFHGEIGLDTELQKILFNIIKDNALGADTVLQNLHLLRVSPSYPYDSTILADALLENATKREVARILLSWHLPLLSHKPILKKAAIFTQEDLNFYEKIVQQGINSPSISDDQINALLFFLCINSSGFIGQIFDMLKNVYTNIDLTSLIKYLVENKLHLDILFEKLELIGRISRYSEGILSYLLVAFPDNRLGAVSRYLKSSHNPISFYNQTLELLAKTIEQKEFPLFLEYLLSIERPTWPQQILINLFINSNLSQEDIFTTATNPTLYKNIVYHCRAICDALSQVDISKTKTFFVKLIENPNFNSLDTSLYSSIVHELINRKGMGDLDGVMVKMIEKVDFRLAQIFTESYFSALRGYRIESESAIRILEKIVSLGKYPFYDIEFLVSLLCSSSEPVLKKFILSYSQSLLGITLSEKLYLALSERNPFNFSSLYIFNKGKLTNRNSKYSDVVKQTYKNCYLRLSFGQKFKAMLLS